MSVPRRVTAVLVLAVAVSVVHYADNWANFADYPQPTSGPSPGRTTILIAWFAFTGLAVGGWLLLRAGRRGAGLLALAAYSGSGLVGIGHYTVAGATSMPWWRQAHIAADIACGVLVLATCVTEARAAAPRVS